MVLDSISLARLVLVAVVLIGYAPIAVAHWRHSMKWVFSAYTVLVTGAIMLLLGSVLNLPFTPLYAKVTVALSGILFFISTHQSKKKIDKLTEDIQKSKVSLGEDSP